MEDHGMIPKEKEKSREENLKQEQHNVTEVTEQSFKESSAKYHRDKSRCTILFGSHLWLGSFECNVRANSLMVQK